MAKTIDGKQIVYKLRNKTTGKFAMTGTRGKDKKNPELAGSIYTRKPPLGYGTGSFYKGDDSTESDWEVVEYALVEINELAKETKDR